ncbi:MAG: phenylacetate--CoA ligase family protein [Desulfarculus sp.]|nr:MAG: phenylacetate--CoA ligase family protein [Desulfarculus sp.]
MSTVDGLPLLKRILAIRRQRREGPVHLTELAKERLRALIRHAAGLPLYQRHWTGLDPEAVDLSDLPPLTKAQVQEGLSDGLAAPGLTGEAVRAFCEQPENIGRLLDGRYIVAHTSGSSGSRAFFVQDRWGWHIGQALNTLHLLAALKGLPLDRLWPPWRLALIAPARRHFASLLVALHTPPIWGLASRVQIMDILDPLGRIVAGLNRLRPIMIHSYPTLLARLARAALAGALRIRPLLITASSEPFTAGARGALARAWPQARLVDVYAASEATPIAWQCPAGGLHYNADWLIIEPVDEAGRTVEPGVMGRALYLTHLFNQVQPLLRYRIQDQVRLLPGECACGSPLPRLELGGRAEDDLSLPGAGGGRVALLPIPLLTALEDCPGAAQLQVVQEADDRLLLRFVIAPGAEPGSTAAELVRLLSRYLERQGVSRGVQVQVCHVQEIARDAQTRKIRQVVNLAGE